MSANSQTLLGGHRNGETNSAAAARHYRLPTFIRLSCLNANRSLIDRDRRSRQKFGNIRRKFLGVLNILATNSTVDQRALLHFSKTGNRRHTAECCFYWVAGRAAGRNFRKELCVTFQRRIDMSTDDCCDFNIAQTQADWSGNELNAILTVPAAIRKLPMTIVEAIQKIMNCAVRISVPERLRVQMNRRITNVRWLIRRDSNVTKMDWINSSLYLEIKWLLAVRKLCRCEIIDCNICHSVKN